MGAAVAAVQAILLLLLCVSLTYVLFLSQPTHHTAFPHVRFTRINRQTEAVNLKSINNLDFARVLSTVPQLCDRKHVRMSTER